MMRILTFSSLFPNAVAPGHGIFVETRLRHLIAGAGVESRVIAPVPWFPFGHRRFGVYGGYAAVPRHEVRNGIAVSHPRFLRLPKVGMTLAPAAMARAGLAEARRLIAAGFDFDLIDAHYFYPDGVAATMVGAALGKPVIITARGTDINLIPEYPVPRRQILGAAAACAAIITVSTALKDRLVGLGADAAKITVLRNGVDLGLFHPEDRATARAAFGIDGFAIASVGNLVPLKGHDLVIEALASMPQVRLLVAGAGPEEAALRGAARRFGVADRVTLLGALPQARLRSLYSAADCLVLASSREGWANVLLESMACGTPVVASRVGGSPEVVAAPEAGELMAQRSAAGIADAVDKLRARLPERDATRAYASRFSWDETSAGQVALFKRVAGRAS